MAFAHASFNSPPNATFDYALQHGFLRNFPHLTIDMWRKNKPNSVVTAKSHLDLHRQNYRSTRQQQSTTPDSPPVDADNPPLDFADAAVLLVAPLKSNDTNYSDLMGRFPVESFFGNNYVLLSYFRGYVHTEPMQDRTSSSLIKAYSATFAYYKRFNQVPKYQRLDNETSKGLESFLRDTAKVTIEYVPPNNKRTNVAERIIRPWRNHYVAGLLSADPRMPLQVWDAILPQTDITYNHLHPWGPNPMISAYEGFHQQPYDFAAHPIAPLGTHVVIYDSPAQRATWAAHGTDGFYLGPALDHYRCYRVFAHATKEQRISDTLAWFPAAVHMPGSSSIDLIHAALQDLTSSLKSYINCPLAATSGQPLALDTTLSTSLLEASNLFASIRLPARSTTTDVERVVSPAIEPPPTASLQRVASTNPTSSPFPTILPLKGKRAAKASSSEPPPFQIVSLADLPRQSQHFFKHIGRRWKDNTTGERFKIVSVSLPTQKSGKGSNTAYFDFYDYDLYLVQPAPADFERTPCSEILQRRSPYVEFLDAAMTPTAAAVPPPAVASAISTAPVMSMGTQYMAAALACPVSPLAVAPDRQPYRWQNSKKVQCHPLSRKRFSANATQTTLNLNADGTPLNYRGTYRSSHSSEWRRMDGAEISRLIDTATITAILRHDCPPDRRKDTTYYNPKPKEKYRWR